MSLDPRPRVALHTDILAGLSPEVRDALDIVEVGPAFDYADLDPRGIRFLAPGPRGAPVVSHLSAFTDLEVLQTASAGTDWAEAALPPGATLCSARGARDAPVAEWVLGALLGASTRLLQRAGAHSWERLELEDLSEWTVLIVGMGSIGRRVQRDLGVFGTRVIGVASHAREDLRGIDELNDLLPDADAVVLLVPLTDATRQLISSDQLALMKDGALLINAARGGVLDTDALVSELQAGRICAVLDVTDPEPLPDGHPLWSAPGVLAITPHIAEASPAGHRAANRLAADQLRRWLAGEPLENVVISPAR